MRIAEVCNRTVVFAERRMSVADAAGLMRDQHVGCLVVAERSDAGRVPTAVVTDRDIVVEVVAKGLDPKTVEVGEIVTRAVVTIPEAALVADAIRVMRGHGVRRLPVVRQDGVLVGLATLDDLLEIVSEELGDIVKVIGREQVSETRART